MIPEVYQPKNGKNTDPDFKPDPEMMEKMGRFNDELRKAGALLSVDGLQPLTTGARLAFSGGKASVTDGPAMQAKEVVGGYWMLEAKSKQQVVDWMKRCPAQDGDVLEIREIAEM
ncbi:MAG: YciI family protein [Opitutaceae bacterium]